MIRARQTMTINHYYAPVLPRVDTLENGNSEVVYKNEAADKLPDADVTKLSVLLAAGVDLKQVPTKILPVHEMVTAFSAPAEITETEQTTKE